MKPRLLGAGIAVLVFLAAMWALTRIDAEAFVEPRLVFHVALALAPGGLGDGWRNDRAYSGLQRASKALAVRIRIAEYRSPEDQTLNLMQLAQGEHDLIIAVGAENADYLRRAAIRFESSRFALIDGEVRLPNVHSVIFDPSEADFLAGALCALSATGSSIVYVGSAGEDGHSDWLRGVRETRPGATVWTVEDSDGPAGIEAALEMGADVFYVALDPVPKFILSLAAGQAPRIVCRSEAPVASWPDRLVAGRVMDTEEAVYRVVERFIHGRLDQGVTRLGVAEGGWLYPEPPESWRLASVAERLTEVMRRQQTSRGSIGP